MRTFAWGGDFGLRFAIDDEHRIRLVHLGTTPLAEGVPIERALGPVEIHVSGSRIAAHTRHVAYDLAERLRYRAHDTQADEESATLTVIQHDPMTGLEVESRWRRFGSARVLRCWSTVRNDGDRPIRLEYVASLSYAGFLPEPAPDWYHGFRVGVPHNSFYSEFRWRFASLAEHGVVEAGRLLSGINGRDRLRVSNLGSMPTSEYLPMGSIEHPATGQAWVWQIEHNGSWQWEIGAHRSGPYLAVSGPTDQDHQWSLELTAGETFETVPVAIAGSERGLDDAFAEMTRYRRLVRRPNDDARNLPIVFNDWMYCLRADPDEAKLTDLIPRVGRLTCDVYCIDAGWYADDNGWWPTVGAWEASPARFPHGLESMTDLIRRHGMVPGLWIEPEVVGVDSPVAADLPDEAFFARFGRRTNARGRYLLDFRHPEVVARMDGIVDRLIAEHGLGYLKLDYNVTSGVGTDVRADSPGMGLLDHNRAFLRWVDAVFARHPGLVIEACSAGGSRLDPATLARHSIASTSDQHDPLRYASIAAASPTALPPEQAGIWVSPLPSYGREELILCLVNGMLARPQLSGKAAELDGSQRELVLQALDVYRGYRGRLPDAIPHWPLGIPDWDDDWLALALELEDATYVSIWRRGGSSVARLPLAHLAGVEVIIECAFPADEPIEAVWERDAAVVVIRLPDAPMARLLRIVSPGSHLA